MQQMMRLPSCHHEFCKEDIKHRNAFIDFWSEEQQLLPLLRDPSSYTLTYLGHNSRFPTFRDHHVTASNDIWMKGINHLT